MTWTRAVWRNKEKRVTGSWAYDPDTNKCLIHLDTFCAGNLKQRKKEAVGKIPHWGNWTLVQKIKEG